MLFIIHFKKILFPLKKKNKTKSFKLSNSINNKKNINDNTIKEEKNKNCQSIEMKNSLSNREIIKKQYVEDGFKIERKEMEIKNQIEEYKSNLLKEFEQLIIEEKKKEDERIRKYEAEKDNDLKQKLEKQNTIERAKATIKINKAKEDMDKKIKEYELKIKQNL